VASEPGFGSDVFEVVDYPAPGSGTYSTHALGVYTTDPFGPEVLVVGYYEDDVGAMHGFLKDSGGFTAIDVPGASGTFAAGINADPNTDTKIVGSYNISASPNREPVNHGFLLVGDSFTTIDVPGAADTVAYGINADGQIVGYYTDAAGTSHGFLLVGDSFTTIDVPGGVDTVAYGINDHGKISGFYADGTGLQHGFVATIQTPESDVLLV
jgi:probable HAF family extracellular repeat protein